MRGLSELVGRMDAVLRVAEIPDYAGALNGLQLENSGRVSAIVAAVDASLPVVMEAAGTRNALLIVHHGMFWQGAQPVTGAFFRKMRAAMAGDLAVYSSHLPLDVHPELGNNRLLAREIGMKNATACLDFKGLDVGLRGEWRGSRDELAAALGVAVGGPVHVCPGGPEIISSVGLCTGGAGGDVARAAACGIEAFITGEGPHWSYTLAEELGVNVFYAGHYATETFGVKALAAAMGAEFGLPWHFIDHPTGL